MATPHKHRPARRATLLLALAAVLCLAFAASWADAAAAGAPTAQQDSWKVLGVRRSATKGEITRAFRRLSRQWHPDKNTSPEATERFQEISAAYEALTDTQQAHTLWETSDTSPPGSRFSATFGTLHFVLDLDPNRLRELLTAWTTDWASKNWDTVGPLWHSPVDRSVCWCLENAWRAPRLADPAMQLLATLQGTKHRQDVWRAWRLSGALLELSAWSSRQSPCLAHHLAQHSTRPVEQDVLLTQLQQQLQTRRKARQAAVEAEQRRQRRAQRGSSSSSTADDGDSAAAAGGAGAGVGAAWVPSAWQGCVVWSVTLVAVLGACRTRSRAVLAAPLLAAAAAVYAVASGLLLPNEAAVQQLAQVLETNGMQATLVGLGFVAFMLSVGLLLPALVAAVLFLAVTWLWAAASCCSIAMTPTISQAGLAIYIAGYVFVQLAGAGDPIRSPLVLLLAGYGLWKMPGIFKWWGSLLLAPAIFLLSFGREVLRACGLWWPAPPELPRPVAEAAAQQATAAAAAAEQASQPLPPPASQAAASPAAASAAPAAAAHDNNNNNNSSSGPSSPERPRRRGSKGSKAASKRRLLPDGAWWPKSFRPADLAVTSHWYTLLLGWHLPRWALSIAAISFQLTLAIVLLAVCAAAFGASSSATTTAGLLAPTLQTVVSVLLLRVGLVVGLLWKLLPVAPAWLAAAGF